jgi:regulator of sigma E protease
MLERIFDLSLVVFGFGLIIFVHELGHFLAARWAGIRVLAFAVGLGPALVSFRKGMGFRAGTSEPEYLQRLEQGNAPGVSPTEYRLNYLPFGGYVKMLGQEDGNPGAVSDANDSYQSCKPWKRMVVISAGVVMNLVTAALLFVIVFMVGLSAEPLKVGAVIPGSPASRAMPINAPEAGVRRAGLQPGDRILEINGEARRSFNDLVLATAMAKADSPVELRIARPGVPTPLTFFIRPEVGAASGLLEMGVEQSRSAQVPEVADPKIRAAFMASLARVGLVGVEPGMTLVQVNGQPVSDGNALFAAAVQGDGKPILARFEKGERAVDVAVMPRPQFQTDHVLRAGGAVSPLEHLLGLTGVMKVSAIADEGRGKGLAEGDIFARVGTVEYPSIAQGISEIKAHTGRRIPVVVLRRDESGELREHTLDAVTVNRKGQIGFGVTDTSQDQALLAAPPEVLRRPGQSGEFVPAATRLVRAPGTRIISINDRSVANFADVRGALREATAGKVAAETTVRVRLRRPTAGLPSDDAPAEVVEWKLTADEVAQVHALGWESPIGGGVFELEQTLLKASGVGEAISMGVSETHRVMLTTYVTFARLFQGTVKIEHLKGPVGIAHLGTLVAGRGMIWLLFFFALISVNLAVINFLPLPVVDGGQFLFLLFEQIRGKPVPMAVQNVATLAGLALILCVFVFVTFNDVRNLLGF